jgi:PIN domain nuclease of toxin-antitoxin system
MDYLLDTHAIVWYFEDSSELPTKVKEIVKNPDSNVYICSISLWEIALKINIGKLALQLPLEDLLDHIKCRDYNILQIEDEYLNKLSSLPSIHKDPFDRMIISSAIVENLTIITKDNEIKKYGVSCIW